MMLLRLITWPYVRKHLLRSVLTTAGIVLGVALLVGMRTANQSVLLAFNDTVDRVAGRTQLQVSAGEAGFSEEVLERKRYRQGELTSHSTDHEWLWVTTLPKQVFPTPVIRQLGHSRWKNENNGWMDLTKHWAFKHGFLHACRHRPKQTNAAGEREPVSNHGLAAVILILLIAFALTSAFVLRHSKLARRDHLTTIAVAAQLRAWVSKVPPSIRAPD